MSDPKKNLPLPLSLDDDNDERTLVDAPSHSGAPLESDAIDKSAVLPHIDEDDDEDATDILTALPSHAEGYEETDVAFEATQKNRAAHSLLLQKSDEGSDTMPAPTVTSQVNAAVADANISPSKLKKQAPDSPQDYPEIRDLNELEERSYGGPAPEPSVSAPKLVKMFFGADEEITTAHEKAKTLAERPVARRDISTPKEAVKKQALGTIFIDVPDEAVIWVDAIAHPPGSIRIDDISNDRVLSVLIACPGFKQWSAQLWLEGKLERRIQPTLEKE